MVRFRNKKKGIFARRAPYRFSDRWISSIIQFNEEKKHFRVLKFIGRDNLGIFDNFQFQYMKGVNRSEYTEDSQFENYIVFYRLKGETPSNVGQSEYFNQKTKLPKIIKLGGDSGMGIGHWNIRSYKPAARYQIREGLKNSECQIISVQESRNNTIQISGYNKFESRPVRTVRNENKLNSLLLVKEELKCCEILKDDNVVGVKIIPSQMTQLYVYSIYCHPNMAQ